MTDISANLWFVIAAYAVTWLAILAYGARLLRSGARARAAHEAAGGKDR